VFNNIGNKKKTKILEYQNRIERCDKFDLCDTQALISAHCEACYLSFAEFNFWRGEVRD
jgi:hypothetical protein